MAGLLFELSSLILLVEPARKLATELGRPRPWDPFLLLCKCFRRLRIEFCLLAGMSSAVKSGSGSASSSSSVRSVSLARNTACGYAFADEEKGNFVLSSYCSNSTVVTPRLGTRVKLFRLFLLVEFFRLSFSFLSEVRTSEDDREPGAEWHVTEAKVIKPIAGFGVDGVRSSS